jgi:hypothetical protein
MQVDTAAFDRLDKVIRNWSTRHSLIKPTLHRRANGPNYWYRLQIVEVWDSPEADEFVKDHFHSVNLDGCIKWVEEKLKDWPECNRKAWDMWDFKHRRDAEKFITLFHLSWIQ